MKRRRMRRGVRRRKGRSLLFSVALGVGMAVWVISFVNQRLSPLLLTLSEARVTRTVTAAVTGRVEAALAAEGAGYSDLVTIETDTEGRITALTANTAGMNALRGRILTDTLQDLDSLSQADISVPLGSLTGWDILAGRGPAIPIGLLATGIGEADFQSVFSAAGVNQTRHRITLRVTVTLSVLLPSGAVERQVTVEVPVAETVIVGQVPQQYFSIGTGAHE